VPPTRRRRKRGAHILSTLLFLAAIAFAVAAGYLYLEERDNDDIRVPTAEPGRNDLGAVMQAIKDGGLDASLGRGTARSDQLPGDVGQLLTVDGETVLVFIYNDSDRTSAEADREAAVADIDLDTMKITTPSNTDLRKGESLHMAQGSNVVTILISDDDELASELETIIEALP